MYCSVGWVYNEWSEPSGDVAAGSSAVEVSHVCPLNCIEGESIWSCVESACEVSSVVTVWESDSGEYSRSGFGESKLGGRWCDLTSVDVPEVSAGVIRSDVGSDVVCVVSVLPSVLWTEVSGDGCTLKDLKIVS